MSDSLGAEELDGLLDLYWRASFPRVDCPPEPSLCCGAKGSDVVGEPPGVRGVWATCEIKANHAGMNGANAHEAFKLSWRFPVKSAQDESCSSSDAFQRGFDDSFGCHRVVELGRESNLESGDAVSLGVLANFVGYSSNRLGSVEEANCEGEARQGLRQPHALVKEEILRDLKAALGGQAPNCAGSKGAVQVSVKICEWREERHYKWDNPGKKKAHPERVSPIERRLQRLVRVVVYFRDHRLGSEEESGDRSGIL